jgi:histidinol-phosphatase (PHP family)
MPDGFSADVRMAPEQLPEYIDLVARARDAWAGKLDVRLGLECDYFPGYEGWVEQQLKLAEFHYVIGSVHPQTAEYRERYRCDAPLEYQQTYFRLLGRRSRNRSV